MHIRDQFNCTFGDKSGDNPGNNSFDQSRCCATESASHISRMTTIVPTKWHQWVIMINVHGVQLRCGNRLQSTCRYTCRGRCISTHIAPAMGGGQYQWVHMCNVQILSKIFTTSSSMLMIANWHAVCKLYVYCTWHMCHVHMHNNLINAVLQDKWPQYISHTHSQLNQLTGKVVVHQCTITLTNWIEAVLRHNSSIIMCDVCAHPLEQQCLIHNNCHQRPLHLVCPH